MRLAVLYEGFSYEIANFQAFVDAAEHIEDNEGLDGRSSVDGMPLHYLGCGAFRAAYRVKGTPYVIKVGDPSENREEYRVYQSLTPTQRRYAARPVAISRHGSVLLMQYVPRNTAKKRSRKVRRMTFALPAALRGDLHSGNIRFTEKGSPKLIDLQKHGNPRDYRVDYKRLSSVKFYGLLLRWYEMPMERHAYNLAAEIYNAALREKPESQIVALMVRWDKIFDGLEYRVSSRLRDLEWENPNTTDRRWEAREKKMVELEELRNLIYDVHEIIERSSPIRLDIFL